MRPFLYVQLHSCWKMSAVIRWIAESVLEVLPISGLILQTCLVFCLAFLLACVLLKRSSNHRLPPYPAGRVPVLGHLLALGRTPHLKLTEWRQQHGDVFTVRMGMEDVVVLNGHTAVKDALVDRSELFAARPPNYMFDAANGFGKDIVTAPWGPTFKQRRKFASVAMKALGMKVGRGSIEEKIREEANYLNTRIAEYDGAPFDIAHDLTVAVANVICSMVFGKRYDYNDDTFRELSEAIIAVMAQVGSGQIISVFPLLRFVPGANRSIIDMLKQLSKIQRVLWEEIARHRENLDPDNPRDFLDYCLLELAQQDKMDGLTEENVMYMAQNLFFAGIDTTVTTLRWSLLYMMTNPAIQNKVQQELDDAIGDSSPSLSQRPQLPFLSATLMEVMRIRHIGPLSIPHATTEDVTVQDYVIPKHTQVIVNLHSLHMDPASWPDPGRFEPERFLDEDGNVLKKPESFLPFSAGRRVCLGEQLARMEMFLFFSTLMQAFTFKQPEHAPPPCFDGAFGLTWTPHPFKLCATPR